ncbi:MAG: hypothetical protein NVS1B4_19610 [Gemmatimonadaceae bacterium]
MTGWSILWRAATILVALAALVPVRTGGLGAHAQPTLSYDDALARADRRHAAEERVVADGGASTLLTHGHRTPRAIVLLHGFSNSPRQFLAFAERLHSEGDNVYLPRLPRHAVRPGSPDDMAGLTAEEMRDVGDAAVDIAHGLGDSVVVVGLSAGGVVAAWAGQQRTDVHRVVAIAPLLELAHIPRLLEDPLMNLALRAPNLTHGQRVDSTRPDRVLGWSTHAVSQMMRLGASVRKAADRSPPAARELVVLLNEHDHTVKAGPAEDLARRWAAHGAAVRVYMLADSLSLPHDVIDPRETGGRTALIYPVLDDLVHGRSPPGWVGAR